MECSVLHIYRHRWQGMIVGYIGGIHSHNTRSCMVASNIIAMYRAADSRMMNKFVKKVAHLWF